MSALSNPCLKGITKVRITVLRKELKAPLVVIIVSSFSLRSTGQPLQNSPCQAVKVEPAMHTRARPAAQGAGGAVAPAEVDCSLSPKPLC